MKKKFKIWFMAFFSLLILAGCQKPMDPKEAAERLVNGIIYQQDVEKVADVFVLNESKMEKGGGNDFIKEIEKILPLNKKAQAELEKVLAENETKFCEQTSFTANVVKAEKGKAEIELAIIGLESLDDSALMKKLDESLEINFEKITAEMTEAEIETLVQQLSYDVLLASFNADRVVKAPETVTLNLMVDGSDKTKWMIQNEDTFINELINAFGQ